jgi:aminoglycoside phosphotransferase (APT) family kinase protein
VLLERVADARLLDAADRDPAWRPRHVATAIHGLASLHAVWFGRGAELRARPWLGHVRSTRDFLEMGDLWTALAEHAAPAFSAWAGAALPALHAALIERAPRWRPALDVGPQTLIHGDFNPRNLCLRDAGRRLCAYDWELATLGAPQRDLAELLCFCAAYGDRELLEGFVEQHRRGLERETGCAIERVEWRAGFAAALAELLVDRLAFYALIQRVRPQPFLPRLLRSWLSLQRFFPVEGCA